MRSSLPGWARPTLPRFSFQCSAWSVRFQPATGPPNSVAANEMSTGMPYLSKNASASSGESGAVPHTTDRIELSSAGSRSASSTIRNAVGTSVEVRGWWRRTASYQPSTVNRSSSAIDRPSLTDSRMRNRPPRCTRGELTRATPDASRVRGALSFS